MKAQNHHPYPSRRSAVVAGNMVAASQPLAVQAGLKMFGEIPKNMFEVCLESFGTQRTLRNHLRTFWEHLEAIFRTLKKIIFLKIFSNFLASQACIFA